MAGLNRQNRADTDVSASVDHYSVQAALPSVMWWVLLPGAMRFIVLCLFFHLPNARFQAGGTFSTERTGPASHAI